MMIIHVFKKEHLDNFMPQAAQEVAQLFFHPEHLEELEKRPSFTVMVNDKPVMCYGYIEFYKTRALLWAILSKDAGTHMIGLHRVAQDFVDSMPHKRIEAEVDLEFESGHRWMKMLGFTCERDKAQAYRPDGGDSSIYVKVKQ